MSATALVRRRTDNVAALQNLALILRRQLDKEEIDELVEIERLSVDSGLAFGYEYVMPSGLIYRGGAKWLFSSAYHNKMKGVEATWRCGSSSLA
jgi:hypothetical protein